MNSSHEVLLEELGREKADVLASAGRKVEDALVKLRRRREIILEAQDKMEEVERLALLHAEDEESRTLLVRLKSELNSQIVEYNCLRENALLCYYYLIVTREALGLRCHTWAEKAYQLPERIKLLCGSPDG